MRRILRPFFRFCPKTGRPVGLKPLAGWSRLFYPFMGFLALAWILIRVIPKPSRITYPCMRVALPLASGLIGELLALIVAAKAFVKGRQLQLKARYLPAAVFTMVGLGASVLVMHNLRDEAYPHYATAYHEPNVPIGEAQGLFPGRVVWVHDPAATNENCNPTARDHAWFLSENNNQAVIDQMLSKSLQEITGTTSDTAAWQAIFSYYNQKHGKGAGGYAPHEKIFVKINATSAWSGNFNTNDLSIVYNANYGIAETSPQLVLALLRQLVGVIGVPQQNIYIGDPMKHIYKHAYTLWHSEFPNIHYLDHDGYAGREKVAKSATSKIYYSDRGAVLRTGTWTDASAGSPVYEDALYTIFSEVDYLINIPTLKAHKHAGVTMFAKNHFGSHTRDNAVHLHGGLVAPEENNPRRQGYGLYRVQVDLMGHELLGGKNLIYILDALWAADYEIGPPRKWYLAPFNNDWMSSLFISFDPVAIESVGFDFLRAEYTPERGLRTYPQMIGVDDYLHQAADSTTWPEGITYDPENDGTPITSLGVHEHWNDATAKQYSRNLDTGQGIELLYFGPASTIAESHHPGAIADHCQLFPNWPNPFNFTTNITFELFYPANITLRIYNLRGELVTSLADGYYQPGQYTVTWDGQAALGSVAAGMYLYHLQAAADGQFSTSTGKMVLLK